MMTLETIQSGGGGVELTTNAVGQKVARIVNQVAMHENDQLAQVACNSSCGASTTSIKMRAVCKIEMASRVVARFFACVSRPQLRVVGEMFKGGTVLGSRLHKLCVDELDDVIGRVDKFWRRRPDRREIRIEFSCRRKSPRDQSQLVVLSCVYNRKVTSTHRRDH